MKSKLEAAGYQVVLEYADNQVEQQVTQIENMITKGCKAIVIASINGTALQRHVHHGDQRLLAKGCKRLRTASGSGV